MRSTSDTDYGGTKYKMIRSHINDCNECCCLSSDRACGKFEYPSKLPERLWWNGTKRTKSIQRIHHFLLSGGGDGGIQYELEASYYYPITNNISIVPAFYAIFNPNKFNSNPTVFVGNLRTQLVLQITNALNFLISLIKIRLAFLLLLRSKIRQSISF